MIWQDTNRRLIISVSVVIPVFNRRELVAAAISSALAQDVDGLTVTVVDNCSDDGTWDVVRAFEGPRCRVIRNEENIGLFGNFNRCGELIAGEFALFLCSDDTLEPGVLRSAVALMQENPSVTMVMFRGREIDPQGNRGEMLAGWFDAGIYAGTSVTPAWFWCSYYCGANAFNFPSGIVFRSSILRAELPFRGELGAPADMDLYFRILKHGNLLVADAVGCRVMRHPGQESSRLRKAGELLQQDLSLIEEHRTELEAAGIYAKIRRQSACAIFATMFRAFRNRDSAQAMKIWRDHRVGLPIMASAVLKRICLRLLRKVFGFRPSPNLQRVG